MIPKIARGAPFMSCCRNMAVPTWYFPDKQGFLTPFPLQAVDNFGI